ncbi:hypothetical protein [Natronincola ferrireducens]|uniref:Uncharacterized protein n=1 Tax=Natronincola ferrireducens TaxID=393762 RepID=A0A1G8ZBF3_9FIRM|nr:hypothetical protein [Natronincola ferrireducens]SDK12399.1 hypothetical protein SAMN05660472_00801 [Natronincola ferrireducens]
MNIFNRRWSIRKHNYSICHRDSFCYVHINATKELLRRKKIKVVVNKPNPDELENLTTDTVAKIAMLTINNLPQNQRLATLEEILRRLKTADFVE